VKVRAEFVNNPEEFFNQNYILGDQLRGSLSREKVIKKAGVDAMAGVGKYMWNALGKRIYQLRPKIGIYFTKTFLYRYQQLGKSANCISQMANHIPGNGPLSTKDQVATLIAKYATQYKDKP
jgi:hypothetical protein